MPKAAGFGRAAGLGRRWVAGVFFFYGRMVAWDMTFTPRPSRFTTPHDNACAPLTAGRPHRAGGRRTGRSQRRRGGRPGCTTGA